jgi:hypothetical protein
MWKRFLFLNSNSIRCTAIVVYSFSSKRHLIQYIYMTSWACPHCTFENTSQVVQCKVCHIKRKFSSRKINCQLCTFLNSEGNLLCEMCGADLPQEQPHENSETDSDHEETLLLECAKSHFDEFAETLESGYRCKFDGRVCGKKPMMCAYIIRHHREKVRSYLGKPTELENSVTNDDYSLAMTLAISDYEVAANLKGKSDLKKPSSKHSSVSSKVFSESIIQSRYYHILFVAS